MTFTRRAIVVLVGGVTASAVAWLSFRAYLLVSTDSGRPESYLSVLSLVVGIIALVAAGFGLTSTFLAFDVRKRVDQVGKDAEKLRRKIVRRAEVLSTFDLLVDAGLGANRPTGIQLAREVASIELAEEFTAAYPEVSVALQTFISHLSRKIEKNAVLSAHAVRLFTSTDEVETIAAAMGVAAKGGAFALGLVARRREIEEGCARPSRSLLKSLRYLEAVFSVP